MSLVSSNLKYLRRASGLTQEQFAQRVGIKRSLLGAYEEGRANPNLTNLMGIAKMFGTSVDVLLQEDLQEWRMSQVPKLPPVPPGVLPTPPPARPRPALTAESTAPRPPAADTGVIPATESAPVTTPAPGMALVRQSEAATYLASAHLPDYPRQLPVLSLPTLPPGDYRAFEMGDDFPFARALVVSQRLTDWYALVDGTNYVLVVKDRGVLYRRVYSQLRVKGALLLSSDADHVASVELPAKEVLEIWEARAFVSTQLPAPPRSLDRFAHLLGDLQQELERLRQ